MDVKDLRLGLRAGLYLLIVAVGFLGAVARATVPIEFNVPAGHAVDTLRQFSNQAKVLVLYDTSVIAGIRTHAVSGTLQAPQALARMLEGTGLRFEFDAEASVLITPRTPSARQTPLDSEPIPDPEEPVRLTKSRPVEPEIVVTGSLIRGVVDLMSPLEVLTKKEMKRTAYATVQDAVQTLPFSSGAVQGEDFAGTGNFNRGSAISLRGLGAGATLVLVNGRRQPQAGINADFVDVSNIPWSMVERIEVLPDGTSALYGSDAIAGVVNIILRDTLEGPETQMRFGTAADGATETVAAQLFGHVWDNGKWLFGYQYSERTSLAATDRWYAADSDKRPLGGRNFSSFRSNPGNILDPRTLQPVFAIPSGQDGTALTPGDLLPGVINWQNTFADSELLPHRKMHAAYSSVFQKIGDRLELFAEGRFSEREMSIQSFSDSRLLLVPASNPFFVDPFGGSPFVIVAYSFLNDLGANLGKGRTQNTAGTLGMNIDIGSAWRTTASASYAEESMRYSGRNLADPTGITINTALANSNAATAFNPFGDGSHTHPATLDFIRFEQRSQAASRIDTARIVADGPIFNLPSGISRLAVGIEQRRESLDRTLLGRDQLYRSYRYNRDVTGIFTELSLPLIGNPTDSRATPRVELSLAARHEKYSDFGSTQNPKIGLHWLSLESVKLRASWGTSFKAPKLLDLYDTSQNGAGIALFRDPRSPTGQSTVLVRQGSNPDLKEETATTWTAGFDLTPASIRGLTFSVTGYAIQYEDQIIQPGGATVSPIDLLLFEDQWAAAITRNPPPSLVSAICNSPEFFGLPSQCTATPPTVFVDLRLRNFKINRVKGVDVTLNQTLDTRYGHFNFGFKGNYVFGFEQAFTSTSPVVDIVDTVFNPLALKLRGTTEWSQRGVNQPGLSVNMTVNHNGAYRDTESPLHRTINSLTTLDLQMNYRSHRSGSWWGGLEWGINAVNIFNKDPPFVDRDRGYDMFNAEPVGRVVSFYVQKNWGHR